MSDNPRQPFLDAIRANPDEDGPRLVYADWLEEHGECDHAELIRLQCLIASSSVKVLDLREEWRQTAVRKGRDFIDSTSSRYIERQYFESIYVTFRCMEQDEIKTGEQYLAIVEIDGITVFCCVIVSGVLLFVGGGDVSCNAYYVKQDDAEAITHCSRRYREQELINLLANDCSLVALEIRHDSPVRGFVETIMPTWEQWRHWHEEILARYPIRHMELQTWPEMAFYMARQTVDVGVYAPIVVPVRMLSLPHHMGAKPMRECSASEFATVFAEETIDLLGRVWPGITFTLPPAS